MGKDGELNPLLCCKLFACNSQQQITNRLLYQLSYLGFAFVFNNLSNFP